MLVIRYKIIISHKQKRMVLSYLSSDSKPLIVITGVTGFIGSQILSHCVNNLADSYRIRGTVRNPEHFEKMEPLY